MEQQGQEEPQGWAVPPQLPTQQQLELLRDASWQAAGGSMAQAMKAVQMAWVSLLPAASLPVPELHLQSQLESNRGL